MHDFAVHAHAHYNQYTSNIGPYPLTERRDNALQHPHSGRRGHALRNRNLLLALPEPRTASPKAHSAHLLPRGFEANTTVPGLFLQAHRRRPAILHRPMGALPHLGAHQRRRGGAQIPRARRQTRARSIRPEGMRDGGRQDVVAVETARAAAEGGVDRDEGVS